MQCAQHCCGSNEPEEIGNIERQPDPLEDEEINAAITGLTCARPRNLIKRIKTYLESPSSPTAKANGVFPNSVS